MFDSKALSPLYNSLSEFVRTQRIQEGVVILHRQHNRNEHLEVLFNIRSGSSNLWGSEMSSVAKVHGQIELLVAAQLRDFDLPFGRLCFKISKGSIRQVLVRQVFCPKDFP